MPVPLDDDRKLMAKRKMLFHADYVREKIRASQLINRLQSCAMGESDLTMPQLFHPDYVREKIRASQLINRLQSCAMGEIALPMPQLLHPDYVREKIRASQ